MNEFNERKMIRKKFLMALILMAIAVGFIFLDRFVLQPNYEKVKQDIESTSSIARNIQNVETQTRNYHIILDESGKTYGNLVTEKDNYISFLGEITMANNLKINKMTVDDIVSAGKQMYTMGVEIELQGDLYNVKNLVQQLYDSETVSRINSFSYRLQSANGQSMQWMWRPIDDQNLVPWWDLTGGESTGTESSGDEEGPLGADAMLAHGEALCYLQIEFLGTGG